MKILQTLSIGSGITIVGTLFTLFMGGLAFLKFYKNGNGNGNGVITRIDKKLTNIDDKVNEVKIDVALLKQGGEQRGEQIETLMVGMLELNNRK